jgi:GH24 family phage-related lysozyme (muramidase)
MTTATENAELMKRLEQYEGFIEHLYVDSKGKATIGVGHMLPNASATAGLTLYVKKTGMPATADQKKAEYEAVMKEPGPGTHAASWYKSKTTLMIKREDADALTKEHIRSFEAELKNIYTASAYAPGFDKFPESVRLALFDMIFNLGATGLSKKWPKFNEAIAKGDWAKAADNCNRPDVQVQRNNYVKGLLQQAADAQKAAAAAVPGAPSANRL